jgi:hypothetical protein
MHWIFDISLAFLVIGLTEAIVKPIAKGLVERQLRKILPVAMEYLDLSMPEMIFQYTGEQMNTALKMKLEDVLGRSISQSELDYVFKTYDPRISSDYHHEIGSQSQ